jgi:putative spermidine/putrescine transport system ATP-binding protein
MADRVCVMSRGRIEQTATPAELYARPATAFVAQFVGTSSRVPVELSGQEVEIFGQRLAVRSSDTGTTSGPLDALLRPEEIVFDVDPLGRGFVTHKSFFGATTRLVVQIEEIPVRVDVRSDLAVDIELGTHVRPRVIARDVLIAPRLAPVALDDH